MGKKNKKLKKKKQITPNTSIALEHIEDDQTDDSQPAHSSEAKIVAKEQSVPREYEHVRKDVRKILFVMLIIVILIITLYFIGSKTTFLTSIGDWFYKVLNIKTQ